MSDWELVKDDRWHWHFEWKGTTVSTNDRDVALSMSFTPGSVRNHYEVEDESGIEQVTDAALEDAAYEFIGGDIPWKYFHRWCEDIVERAKEIDSSRETLND